MVNVWNALQIHLGTEPHAFVMQVSLLSMESVLFHVVKIKFWKTILVFVIQNQFQSTKLVNNVH